MTKQNSAQALSPEPIQTQLPQKTDNDGLAITSMVLGIVSIIGFMGFILGIPAIILGIIALRKNAGEKALSIVGIVTGSVATLVSLVVIGLFIVLTILGATQPQRDYNPEYYDDYDYRYDSSRSSEL